MVNVTGLTPVFFMKDNRRRYPKNKTKNLKRKTSLQCFTIFRNPYVYLLLDFLHWNATILSSCHLYVYKISMDDTTPVRFETKRSKAQRKNRWIALDVYLRLMEGF